MKKGIKSVIVKKSIISSKVKSKYTRLKQKITRAIQDGRFYHYSKYKQQKLLRRLQRYYQQLLRRAELVVPIAGIVLASTQFVAAQTFVEVTNTANPFINLSVSSAAPFGLLNLGGISKPSFIDIDGDGDLDAFVGEGDGNINYFENTGDSENPTFTLQSTNGAFGLTDVGSFSAPSFIDIDGDGDLDAFVGEGDGNINYFENTSTDASIPAFTLQSTDNAFGLTDVGGVSTPSFIDIDGDGDLDAFIGELDGNINYFENTGTITAPAFTLQSTNGAFGLSDIGQNSNLSFVDIDGDGDLDAFAGESYGNINYFENIGTITSPNFFILQSTSGAFGLSDVRIYSTPTFADIDGDGDFDAFIGDEKGTVNYFENTDTSTDNSVPNFVSTSVDVGLSSAPSFVDIDGDGDFDAFVGELNGNINYFENTGTIASPTFTLQSTNNAFGLSDVGLYSSPSFVDIDGDGDLDVFVGEYDGNINYFENTGTITAPAFTLQSTNGAFGLSDVGLYASPSFADIDGDGDLDAFVGERDGNINYFENTGTITAPAFTLQSTNGAFGLSDVGLSSSPSFVDIDRDGDLDAFVGERDGNINYFENTSTDASIPAFTLQSTDNAFGLTDVGINSTPSLVDIDGDGDFDVFIGKYDGNINYFKNVLCNEEGQEFQVNTYTTNRQNRPSVASNSEGDFVVVWESRGQDGSYYGIYGQRYTSSGSTVGSEFQINTYTPNRQLSPKVAMDEVGNFVVVWESREQDGDRQGIFGQLYNSDGTLNGSEFQINTFTTNRQQLPEVAMDADGDFVVVWESLFQDGASMGVFGQLYNSDGTTNGGEFQVNTETISYQDSPSVAMDADGDFAVVWSSQDQDGSERSIFGQLYNSDGTSNGAEFQINTETNDDQRAPSVAMDDTGNFVVVWTSVDQDGSEEGVFGQRYFNDGTANGVEFQVNTETNNDQGAPSVSLDADGDFVVVWESEGQDGSSIGIFGQRFQNNGFPLGSEFLVNAEINNNQNIPAVAMDGNGDFVVVWQSQYQDGDDNGIFGQRYIGVCTQDCKSDPLTLSNSENANQNYYTQAEITSTQSIESGAVVLYQAATTIELQAGFHAQSGAVFTAKIEDCAASASASNEAVTEQRTEEVEVIEVVEEILTTDNDKLHVFPNPTNGVLQFTIPSEAKVQSIALYDQLGKLVRQVPIHERQLSLADLGIGMYVLVVRTEEGTYMEKVLRKQ